MIYGKCSNVNSLHPWYSSHFLHINTEAITLVLQLGQLDGYYHSAFCCFCFQENTAIPQFSQGQLRSIHLLKDDVTSLAAELCLVKVGPMSLWILYTPSQFFFVCKCVASKLRSSENLSLLKQCPGLFFRCGHTS